MLAFVEGIRSGMTIQVQSGLQPTSASWTLGLRQVLTDTVATNGFSLGDVASAMPSPETANFLERWVDAGHAGEMEYLKRRDIDGTLLRSSIDVALPWAKSVVVCALNYNADALRSIDPAPDDAGWIARYAWSGNPEGQPVDYHDDLLARLHRVEAALQAHAPCTSRCYVDTGPILERNFAARAGVGWIGKNTCVLHQQLGSWLLLGVIITSLELPSSAAPLAAPDRCGSCTRCIDACPTNALLNTGEGPRAMNASLCISYLTIEKKGSIPEELREPMGRQVFGCDICQEVCPWNRKAPVAPVAELTTRRELVNPSLDWLAALTPATFRQFFQGSPLERTKLNRLHRNTAIAMGNSGSAAFLPELEGWAAGDDPILAEAAQWAIAQIQTKVNAPDAAPSLPDTVR